MILNGILNLSLLIYKTKLIATKYNLFFIHNIIIMYVAKIQQNLIMCSKKYTNHMY